VFNGYLYNVQRLDVKPKHEHISVFKMGKLWVFKHFFDNKELFEELLDCHNKD